jgi:uncharacterized protein (UPF0261 family)
VPPNIYAIATMDTKGHELTFVAEEMERVGGQVLTVDVGTGPAAPPVAPGVAREVVADCHPGGRAVVLGITDRGCALAAMSEALSEFLRRRHAAGELAGVIGLGGSGGTALLAPALRALPLGVPKVLVSTVASGNTAPYVGCSDIVLVPSVVDVAGLNAVSRVILSNAAHAVAGMVAHRTHARADRPLVGMTMFGVTTPCVTAARRALEARGYDCLVFHATGTGGRAMEELVHGGVIGGGVLDITTTEVADEVVGGVFTAGPQRFDAIVSAGVPYVLSLGALDMVNFGARDTVPPQFRDRTLHVHNAQVTLMRTTAAENREFARWIARKLNESSAPLVLLAPEGGLSQLDAPGQAFHDPVADGALFDELEASLKQTPSRRLVRLPYHINDPLFAAALVETFLELTGRASGDHPSQADRSE